MKATGTTIAEGKVCLPHQLYYPPLDLPDRVGLGRTVSDRFARYVSSSQEAREAILYVHVPFCATICEFCTFDRGTLSKGLSVEAYLKRLFAELELYASSGYAASCRITGVHVGGGTPSMLTARQIETLVVSIRRAFNRVDGRGLVADAPIDFEVTPLTLTDEKIEVLQGLGIRKISFGVQTFDANLRRAMNLCPLEAIHACNDRLRAAGFAVYADLMYGLPGQNSHILLDDLRRMVVELAPDGIEHSQFYPFGSPLAVRGGKLADEYQTSDEMVGAVREGWRFLERSGYEQKSSYMFCKRLDNMLDFAYHGDPGQQRPPQDCIGIGPSAYGFMGPFHYRNVTRTDYVTRGVQGFPLIHVAESTAAELEDRRVILFPRVLALHKATVSSATLARFRPALDALCVQGLVEEDAESLRLTEEGRLRFDNVMLALIPRNVAERIRGRVWATR